MVAVPVGLLVVVPLFIVLSDKRFGIQIATAITYTAAVFWTTFFPGRWSDTGYSLGEKAVREKLPRLLAIHSVFVVLIFSMQTVAFAARPHLPTYWLTEHGPKHDSLYECALLITPLLIGTAQVLIARGILSRSTRGYSTNVGLRNDNI